jgi:hypothetical protein
MFRRRTGKDKVSPSNKDSGATRAKEEQPRAEIHETQVNQQIIIKPRSKRRNGFIFMLGGFFGIFVALFFASQHEVISLDSLMDLNLDSWIEAIPQGIVSDVKEFSVRAFQGNALVSACGYHVTDFQRGHSNMNAIPSAMIRLLLGYNFELRA